MLGARVTSIVGLPGKDFRILVGIAPLIAFLIAWWAMYKWLDTFAYHTEKSWWIFLVAGAFASEIRKDIFILEPKYAMTPADYISKQEKDRRGVLSSIHALILEGDPTVSAEVGIMMGKEMILYKERGVFKYGLAAVKNYMSLHVMPIYMDSPLHGKYRKLLPDMEFQKGCINFTAASQDSLETIHLLFADCAKVSIAEMLENRKKRK